MTTAVDRLLVDTNVLVYASLRHSPWHAQAAKLLALVQSVALGGKQIHDANLVATMQAYGICRLLTHNVADFTRFRTWIEVVPIST